jgi:DNA-binding response OmpR family regulator
MAKVLICDDEAFFREAVGEILRGESFDVLAAQGGAEALELVARQDVGVVVLDVMMPGVDGLETLRRLRAEHPDVQVVMFTAHGDEEVILNALRLGACDYLAKPIHAGEMALSVHKAMEAYELLMENKRKLRQLKTLVDSARKLSEISQEELSYQSLTENILLLQTTVDLIAEILEVERVSIMLVDPGARELRVAVANGFNLDEMAEISVRLGQGIAGRVVEEGAPILVEDIDKDERFEASRFAEQYETRSFISAPLRIGNRVVGVINANDKRSRKPFTENDLVLLVTFSYQISLTLENALIDSDRRRASDALNAMRPLADALQNEVDPRAMFGKMGETAREAMAADQMAVYRWDVDGGALRRDGIWGETPEGAEPCAEEVTGPEGAVWAAYERGEVFRGRESGGAAVIVEPLRLRGKPVGALRFARGAGNEAFSAGDGSLAGTIAQMWSLGVRSAWLTQSLTRAVDDVARIEREMMALKGELKRP